MAFLHTERQSTGHHRTQQSSVFCMQEVACSSLGPETSRLDWGLLWFPTVLTESDVRPRPLPPKPFSLIISLPTYSPRYWVSLNKPWLNRPRSIYQHDTCRFSLAQRSLLHCLLGCPAVSRQHCTVCMSDRTARRHSHAIFTSGL